MKYFKNNDIILDNIVVNNDRKMITIERNGILIINVKANNFDKHCINNYHSNCNKEFNYRSYVGNLIKEFESSYNDGEDSFGGLILNYVHTFHIMDKVINDYYEFLKDNIIFKFIVEPVEYSTNGKSCLFKS